MGVVSCREMRISCIFNGALPIPLLYLWSQLNDAGENPELKQDTKF